MSLTLPADVQMAVRMYAARNRSTVSRTVEYHLAMHLQADIREAQRELAKRQPKRRKGKE